MSKLAIISDIHDNIPNLQKVINIINKEQINYLICTGDVQSIEAWQIIDNLKIPVYAVLGNVDQEMFGFQKLSSTLKNIKLFDNLGEVELENKKIIFNHYPDIVKNAVIAHPNSYDLALYGHSHQPWEEKYKNTKILNPGNVGNFRFSPTFAIMDLKTLKAKLILLDELQ